MALTQLHIVLKKRTADLFILKIASALENFPATVIMPSAWPD